MDIVELDLTTHKCFKLITEECDKMKAEEIIGWERKGFASQHDRDFSGTISHTPVPELIILRNCCDSFPKIEVSIHQPCYMPAYDIIRMPPIETYTNPAKYYQTIFHELVHSTGYRTRLNRNPVEGGRLAGFCTGHYTTEEIKEEALAEIGSFALCVLFEIETNFDWTVHFVRWFMGKITDRYPTCKPSIILNMIQDNLRNAIRYLFGYTKERIDRNGCYYYTPSLDH